VVDRPSGLPARRSRLVGRDVELAAVGELLVEGGSRLVTLTGTGGAGKTTLAIEVARRLEPELAEGAALIDLSVVAEPADLARACCQALGVVEQEAPPLSVLTDHLAPRHMLLVLDNCEHLLTPVGALTDRLLDACPDLRLLATSRRRLGVRGESAYAVPPLAVPDAEAADDLDRLARVPAVALFVERAAAADRGFVLADWGPAVAALCRRLEGLPLAIELAAAQLSALTPPEIEARLGRLVQLEGPGPTRSGRHRTLQATLDTSHDLLDEAEQLLFRRLAVFRGGWTLDAAEQICALDIPPARITAILVSLVDHSLVIRDDHGPTRRFRMLEPIAHDAARRLDAAGEFETVSLAHAYHYLATIGSGTSDWREIEPEQVELIAAEYDNCLAALRFAEREALVPIVLGFNVSLLLFWRIRGLLRSGMQRLEAALSLVGAAASIERGLVLAGLAHFGQLLGDLQAAAVHATESEETLAAAGDLIGRRTVIGFLGDIAADQGDVDGALDHYGRARALIEPDTEASALDLGFWHANVGRVMAQTGDLTSAERQLNLALAQLRTTSRWYQGYVLVQLGSLARRRVELDRAETLLSEALEYLRLYNAAIEAVACLVELALLALDRTQHLQAATLLAAAAGYRDVTGARLGATDRERFTQAVDRTRSALTDEVFTEAWDRGRGLSLDQAVALATAPSEALAAQPPPGRGARLTPRERQVADLVALGLTNPQIAQELTIATGTARIHVERILGKLGLTSRVQIATWIIRGPDVPASRPQPET
jgi:predicted ATPase/DNA-binding CsgD family transcriptional regulator